MSRRSHAIAFLVVGAVPLQGCITANVGCYGSGPTRADSGSLGVVLGAPSNRFAESQPFIVLYSPSQAEPQELLELKLIPASILWPGSLDETPCEGIDWRTFRVSVDPVQWARFSELPQPSTFEARIGFLESATPLRSKTFGVASVDTASAEVFMSCGCYGHDTKHSVAAVREE
jgi:hypothetical protein